ncbi:MAG TPA: hypothetical protein VKB36_04615 [Vicinamibacterales bacterium]|nr:hypothetical protein [Vicinamibacterales bacterium]
MVRPLGLLTLSLTLLITPGTPLACRAAAGAAAALPVDGGWPRVYATGSGARLVLYEPQVASWANQKRIAMYAAVSYSGKDQRTPALGTLRIEADTRVSRQHRLVDFSDLTITAANFPTLSLDQLTAAVAEINTAVPRDERVIGLDRVLAALDTSRVTPRNVDGVRADPPAVFYSTKPAVLINLDGDPIWSPTGQNDLRFAVNASQDLFEHIPSSSYYVRIDTTWMTATSLDGPWTRAGRLPESFSKLPGDDRWKDARSTARERSAGSMNPTVLVSRRPAELILLRGGPVYVPVRGTGLLWISNTDSDVFRAGKTGPVYYLVSGRWFSAPDFKGPWTFATPTLPGDFRKISVGHPRSYVLASVPGTTQALEAVLLAQVPQTARVSRTAIAAPDVAYQGEPQFQPIEQATVARAVNTDKDILKVDPPTSGGLFHYYMCYGGIWFVSTNPTGPWTLADSIPKQIYEIPISSPVYAVTNVTVQSADDGAVVYAADAAYTGLMVSWGCAVWGTGWYYPPYVGWKGHSPVYYARHLSYGYGARYNPWTGSYTHAGVHGPVLSRQGADVYGEWGSNAVERGDRWAKASRFTNRATSATMRATQGRGGEGTTGRRDPEGGTALERMSGGNVFAGYDGHVYRNQGGFWQKYGSDGWNTVERESGTSGQSGTQQHVDPGSLSSSTRDQLNHDLAARRAANQRTSDVGAIRSGPAAHDEASGNRPTGVGSRNGA